MICKLVQCEGGGVLEKYFYLRKANVDDVKLFFKWVNESAVRENSFNTEPIPWENHQAWFKKVLANEDIRIYVMMQENNPIGQVRLALENSKWLISYSIASSYRGQGYGQIILQLAENEMIREGHTGEILFAEVKVSNIASQRIFIKLGYKGAVSEHSNAYAYIKMIDAKEQVNGKN